MSKFSRKLQKLHDTAPRQETAVLVTLVRQHQPELEVEEHLAGRDIHTLARQMGTSVVMLEWHYSKLTATMAAS